MMGLRPEDFQAVRLAPSPEVAAKLLGDLKERFRSGFKKLAFELHPDRTGGDPQKTEDFKALIQLREGFERLQVPEYAPEPPAKVYSSTTVFNNPPPPPKRKVVIHYYPRSEGGRATVTTEESAGRVAGMAPRGVHTPHRAR